ncbi:hypothetical protein ACIGXF_38850 [Streptomyces sp. NPDC053086]|uniref:hypothetical protein n=1 Tax=unclassified Streptomyces TaxID=2593676 RepID=UPI0037D8CE7C
MTGAVPFAKAATTAGIQPVFGVAAAPRRAPRSTVRPPRTPARGGAHVVEPPLRVTLLARTAAGWARLCRLVSRARGRRGTGRRWCPGRRSGSTPTRSCWSCWGRCCAIRSA